MTIEVKGMKHSILKKIYDYTEYEVNCKFFMKLCVAGETCLKSSMKWPNYNEIYIQALNYLPISTLESKSKGKNNVHGLFVLYWTRVHVTVIMSNSLTISQTIIKFKRIWFAQIVAYHAKCLWNNIDSRMMAWLTVI